MEKEANSAIIEAEIAATTTTNEDNCLSKEHDSITPTPPKAEEKDGTLEKESSNSDQIVTTQPEPQLEENKTEPQECEQNPQLTVAGGEQHESKDVSQQSDADTDSVANTDQLSVEETATNVSTEVLCDNSISERLSALSLNSIIKANDSSTSIAESAPEILTENIEHDDECSPPKPAKSEELCRSILAGEVSDKSECSVDEDQPSESTEGKAASGNVSDEEMFIEDQDEDVEEEEEFHEVEEEKHKTSQESVGDSKTTPQLKEESVGNKNPDWAALMHSTESDETKVEGCKPEDKSETAATQDDKPEGEKLEEVEKKELDLDEDVKNPQYIPKKGVFYEHDDRSHDSNEKKSSSTSAKKEETNAEVKEVSSSKKATNQEKQADNKRVNRRQRTETDKWNHDLFKDDKQKQKSRSELINAYGYDIRQERSPRNDGRPSRSVNNGNAGERQPGSQENRSRTNRDNRTPRQPQTQNRSRDRRSRRTNNRNRDETMRGPPKGREPQGSRQVKLENRDPKVQEGGEQKQLFTNAQPTTTSSRRDQDGPRDRNPRNDNRGRRVNSYDRPAGSSTDEKLPPINTVMPPITTWSNKIEEMVKEENNRKESPSRYVQQPQMQHGGGAAGTPKTRSNEFWPQNHANKNNYYDRPPRNYDDRHQPRRFQDREEGHKPAQYMNRSTYNDRPNHQQEWRRTNHYNNSYAKPSDYEPVKTQTFENSKLSQSNLRQRDAREIINERRMLNTQNFQTKVQPGHEISQLQQQHHQQQQQQQPQHPHQQQIHQPRHHPGPQQAHHHHQQQTQQHRHQPHHQHLNQHQQQQHHHHQQLQMMQSQQHAPQLSRHQQSSESGQGAQSQQQQQQHQQPTQGDQSSQQQLHTQRQHQPQQQQQHANQQQQQRGAPVVGNISEATSGAGDLINSRPIIKTDSYTGPNVAPMTQQGQTLAPQQHSQSSRSLGGPLQTQHQQGTSPAGSQIVAPHLAASGSQNQYYPQPNSSRDSAAAAAAAAALASAYHGYMPGGHSVIDANRYHMASQPISDHGYMASQAQTGDVGAASVIHQHGMYPDAASAGGTVPGSAYMPQAASTLSTSTTMPPVTGAGPPPLAPVSYLQHSQYAPPPYSNPYSQPQHNQAPPPPQSSHGYPYWTYI